jgi:hypothetical protein
MMLEGDWSPEFQLRVACVSPVVQTVSYDLDTSRNMAAVYSRSLNLSITYSVNRSRCSVVSRLVRRRIVLQDVA